MLENLCAEIIDIIRGFLDSSPMKYLSSIDKRISSIKSFVSMLKDNSIESNDVEEALKNSINIIKKVYENSNDLHSIDFVPMNNLFEQAC